MQVAPLVLNYPMAPVETFVLVATRLLAALATSPVVSARTVPAPARLGLGAFTALAMVPIIGQGAAAVDVSWTSLVSEILVGTLAGFAATLIYSAIQFGAGLIDVQAGFALATVYDSTFGEAGALIERFYGALAGLLFLETNGHHLLLNALRQLFVLVPLGTFSVAMLQPELLATLLAGMFRIALELVLPIVAALLLTDTALAILARVAPQFNIFVVGTPAKIGIAIAALLVTLPLLLPRLDALFNSVAAAMLGFAR